MGKSKGGKAARGGGGGGGSSNAAMYAMVAVAAIVAVPVLLSLWDVFFPPYITLSVDDDDQMQETFFGGEAWLVMCTSERHALPESFLGAAKAGSASGQFRSAVLDCEDELESGVNTLDRFKLRKNTRKSDHVAMLVANGESPRRIPHKILAKPKGAAGAATVSPPEAKLLSFVRDVVVKRVVAARNNGVLEKCLSRRTALILLTKKGKVTKSDAAVANRLMGEYKKLRVCAVDKLKYVIDSKPTLQDNSTKLILFMPKSGSSISSVATTFKAKLSANGAYDAIAKHLDQEDDTTAMTTVTKPATMRSRKSLNKKPRAPRKRKSKKEEKERPEGLGGQITRKRQRKKERAERATAVRAARARKKEEYQKDAPARAERKKRAREKMDKEQADNAFVAQAVEPEATKEAEKPKEEKKPTGEDGDDDDDDDEEGYDLGGDDLLGGDADADADADAADAEGGEDEGEDDGETVELADEGEEGDGEEEVELLDDDE